MDPLLPPGPAAAGGLAPSSAVVSLLLADARLPVGGHTQSAGLEPALRSGLPPEALPAYCRARLATVVPTEAATAVVTAHLLRSAQPASPTRLAEVAAHWAARTPSDAQRHTALELGRGLLRMAGRLWPGHPLLTGWTVPPVRPLVLGAIGAVAGVHATDLARVVAYEDVQTVVAAGLKLSPADPLDSLAWTWELLPDVDAVALAVGSLTRPVEIPSSSAPQIEEWAQAHSRATRRLFRA
ncbi:urease accessory protein UreF [Nocardioides campestrisoli]|uniref:urease accessory protein UreF n=1 Tax=Nocardioides campestrisoli TaxID=2736757 RepID=UPI0015E7894C|nr:urease accessory UreF family protein [Nocardioides campestrisoli]